MGAGSWSRTGRARGVDASSGSSLVIKRLEEWLIPEGSAASEGPGQVGEMGREEPLEIPQRQRHILHLGRNNPRQQHRLGRPVGSNSVEKDWGAGAGVCMSPGVEFQKSGVLSETEGFEELQRQPEKLQL